MAFGLPKAERNGGASEKSKSNTGRNPRAARRTWRLQYALSHADKDAVRMKAAHIGKGHPINGKAASVWRRQLKRSDAEAIYFKDEKILPLLSHRASRSASQLNVIHVFDVRSLIWARRIIFRNLQRKNEARTLKMDSKCRHQIAFFTSKNKIFSLASAKVREYACFQTVCN